MPEHATLANFSQWFTQLNFGSYFTNSLIVAVITVLGNMVFCSMVGYALAKMKFVGKNILFGAVMVTLMVPSVATFVPLFVIISNVHLANTYAALILPFLCQPIGVFLMRQFIGGIPDALMEAARGWCWRTAYLLPDHPAAMRSGTGHTVHPDLPVQLEQLLMAVGLRAKRGDVHAAGGPVPLFHGPERHQLQCAARRRRASYHPILLLFVFLQRYFIQGVAMTGIK